MNTNYNLNNKQIVLYNTSREVVARSNNDTALTPGIQEVSLANYSAKADRTQILQLNQLIALGSIGFTDVLDQQKYLADQITKLDTSRELDYKFLSAETDKIKTYLERIIKTQELQPTSRPTSSVPSVTESATQTYIINQLDKVLKEISLIPKDIHLPTVTPDIGSLAITSPIAEKDIKTLVEQNKSIKTDTVLLLREANSNAIKVTQSTNSIIGQLNSLATQITTIFKAVDLISAATTGKGAFQAGGDLSNNFLIYDPPNSFLFENITHDKTT